MFIFYLPYPPINSSGSSKVLPFVSFTLFKQKETLHGHSADKCHESTESISNKP